MTDGHEAQAHSADPPSARTQTTEEESLPLPHDLPQTNRSTIRSRSVRAIMEPNGMVCLCLLRVSCAGQVGVCGTAPALDNGPVPEGT